VAGTGHHAQDIDRHHALEVGQVVVEEAAMHLARGPGVVHHDVEPAEGLDGSRDQGPDLFGVRDVGQTENHVAAQLGGQLFTTLTLDVGDHHSRALGQELLDDSGADAGGTSGDDLDLVEQFIAHAKELIGSASLKSSYSFSTSKAGSLTPLPPSSCFD